MAGVVSFSKQGSSFATEDESAVVQITTGSNVPSEPTQLAAPASLYQQEALEKKNYCCQFKLFERSSNAWWNPRFDSTILEEQYRRSTFLQICQRFQYSLLYMFIVSVSYCIFSACMAQKYWIPFFASCFAFLCYVVVIFIFTFTQHFQNYYFPVSIATTTLLCVMSLTPFVMYSSKTSMVKIDLSPVGMFCWSVEVLLLLYTVIPITVCWCVIFGIIYSVTFEVFLYMYSVDSNLTLVFVRVLLHVCIHIISLHTLVMSEIRMRNTFMKVGQSLIVRKELEMEKQLKEKMIHSVMPPKVAIWLMSTQEAEDEGSLGSNECVRRVSASPRQSQMIFRPFNMHCMDDVSILFADIVGFTNMSSNKTAEQLVGLLNDLFGRFDYLCAKLGCEKISTLGDCYYCVSGCPDPKPDHAKCCVEMGLGMIKAIGEFDEDTNEDVNMRVGIHTGTVLCGIVGTYRFKFDVWSNDVSFANFMESTGKPGKVHISDATLSFLHEYYHVEEGLPQKGHKTYFIRGRKPVPHERIITLHSSAARHSWPTHPIGEMKNKSNRKPSSQSEKGETGEEDVPMLRYTHDSSHSTVSSSRKDSGIRSRQSSLQDVELDTSSMMPAHLFGHRFSGYETSSQTSIADTGRSSGSSAKGCSLLVDPNLSLNVSLARARHIRKQSDLHLIRCVQQDASHLEYFMRPPVNKLSLFFLDSSMERLYRKLFHSEDRGNPNISLSPSIFNTYCDIFVSCILFSVIAASCFLLFTTTTAMLWIFVLGAFWHAFMFLLCICELVVTRWRCRSSCMSKLYKFYTTWYPWHFCGVLLVCLPAISIYSNFSCQDILTSPAKTQAFCFLVIVSLVQFCNFAQLNSWLKSFLACATGISFIYLASFSSCYCPIEANLNFEVKLNSLESNSTSEPFYSSAFNHCQETLVYEIILDIALLILLVWFINREFEISYRLSFHGNIMAIKDRKKMQLMKNQADWLLHNIIPKHVVEQLKLTSKYSENHKDAGILFASIVNFNEMYDESYEGGKEYLRVLNELVGDFDELIQMPQFRNVEKIKTIGSTYMAASGLNHALRLDNPHPHTHLLQLLDFALALQQVIERFNMNLLEFNFIVRIGYNFGDVTAGVIGTTKLYYDIWGDAVNIASRMDSTGVPGRIQLPEHCVESLKESFTFEPRGGIYVKGKDTMNVYLVTGKITSDTLNDSFVSETVVASL